MNDLLQLARLTAALLISLLFATSSHAQLTPVQQLGEFLYFDATLSEPDGQSCASCHEPSAGFADPDQSLPVSEGVKPGLFGNRNSPSATYAMFAPALHYDANEQVWVGGQFWDGRARGDVTGEPLADQAMGPFLNPLEMANPNKATVIREVRKSGYADLFKQVWGRDSLDDVDRAYEYVAKSIAAFERSASFARFDSRYDAYLEACLEQGGTPEDCAQGRGEVAYYVGRAYFSRQEWRGFELFIAENDNDGRLEAGEGAMCAACHVADWVQPSGQVTVPDWSPDGRVPPLFTDFTYDNLGVPKSNHPLLADAPVDPGLGAVVASAEENGKFKVVSVRNIGLTAPYAHNGFFDELTDLVHFYNTRDVPQALDNERSWPPAEVPQTVNRDELGNLGLSERDELALTAFMKTLTDGYRR